MRQFLDAARVRPHTISVIVPTIGRVESLGVLLEALAVQTRRPDEIIVADGSSGTAVEALTRDSRWVSRGLEVRYLRVSPPNAVRQREAAIACASGTLLLLLDDDVAPEPECVAALLICLQTEGAAAVSADFSNQSWPRPTALWRWYLGVFHGITGAQWQGKVIGPLLRFGYRPVPSVPVPMEWLGTCNTLLRRDIYDLAGGFSNFFLHRSTMNEDVDLGIKVARFGRILLCPAARLAHFQSPTGRVSARLVAEDDLFNRYVILRQTLGYSRPAALSLALVYFAFETLSGLSATVRHRRNDAFTARCAGRLKALARIATIP